jgi:hypothetical protein
MELKGMDSYDLMREEQMSVAEFMEYYEKKVIQAYKKPGSICRLVNGHYLTVTVGSLKLLWIVNNRSGLWKVVHRESGTESNYTCTMREAKALAANWDSQKTVNPYGDGGDGDGDGDLTTSTSTSTTTSITTPSANSAEIESDTDMTVISEGIDGIVSQPERVETYLADKEGDRLPFSCTLATLDEKSQIDEIIRFTTKSLKAGAGVKMIITDKFKLGTPKPEFKLYQYIDSTNDDVKYFDEIVYPERFNQFPRTVACTWAGDSIDEILDAVSWVWKKGTSDGVDAVAVDLTLLRPRDTKNSKGLVASGAVIFTQLFNAVEFHIQRQTVHSLLKLFGTLNAVILRGGYKKGIVTSAIEDTSPLLHDYLSVPLVSLPGSHKKGVILSTEPDAELKSLIISKVNSESMFLQKSTGDGTYANVCQGIFLSDRGTCLIYRINLGLINDISQIVPAFKLATKKAIQTHQEWRILHPERAKGWASIEDDRQVAVDVMGLANLLHTLGIEYTVFINALQGEENSASELVEEFCKAYKASSEVADSLCEELGLPKFERLHTVEPAQSHSYRSKDIRGKTVARGIFTPFARIVNRMSDNEQTKTYDYGGVEVRMSPENHFRLCNAWMEMMTNFGRVHSFSYDTLSDWNVDSFNQWYESELRTLYYNLSRDYNTEDYGRKTIIPVVLCPACEY